MTTLAVASPFSRSPTPPQNVPGQAPTRNSKFPLIPFHLETLENVIAVFAPRTKPPRASLRLIMMAPRFRFSMTTNVTINSAIFWTRLSIGTQI